MLKSHEYEWGNVVIGGTLDAVQRAHKKNNYFILNNVHRIFAFDTFNTEDALGVLKKDAYESALYDLNLKGLNPLTNKSETIRIIPEDDRIIVSTKDGAKINIKYSSLEICDVDNISGAPFETPKPVSHFVYDWFDVKSGMKHDLYTLEDSESHFVKKVHFYKSKRIHGNHGLKDLVSESYIREGELEFYEHSENISRLKTLSMMKEAGIKGTSNGKGRNLSIKLEFAKREVIPVYETIYKKKGNISLLLG